MKKQLTPEQIDFNYRVKLALKEYAPMSDIPLSLVMGKFGLRDIHEASRRAADLQLPIPFYRHGSQKSEYYCSAKDLAEYMAMVQMAAIKEFREATNRKPQFTYTQGA